jgi:DNA-binding ferritin-like protein (Dps family)
VQNFCKWRNLETRIKRLKEEYNIGVRNVDDYWEATSHFIASIL